MQRYRRGNIQAYYIKYFELHQQNGAIRPIRINGGSNPSDPVSLMITDMEAS